MRRTIVLSAIAIAGAAFILEWLEFRTLTRSLSTELYIVLIASGCTALGAWAGHRLTNKTPAPPFAQNEAALKSLGITAREVDVLTLIAAGQTNKEIARDLGVSPNTIKTHVARLYDKLDVQRRTQAVQKAKDLALIP
ncbi:MAG: response regulator transcription factor [Pseudomonadota bacterium]